MGPRQLIVSDLDGTLIGNAAALRRFSRWLAPRRGGFVLAYASGRHRDSITSAIVDDGLPRPEAVISAVGTEIHDAAGLPWPGWLQRLDNSFGDRVRASLGRFHWLELQAPEHQSALKASYQIHGLSDSDLSTIRGALGDDGLVPRFVYSGGVYLDVIPMAAGKGLAAAFVAETLGIPHSSVLAFGDSGNDRDLLDQGFRGTVVANAMPELLSAMNGDVYLSPRAFADGVLDGVRHWSVPARAISSTAVVGARRPRLNLSAAAPWHLRDDRSGGTRSSTARLRSRTG